MFDASFFFHTFLVFPACKKILNFKPNQYSKKLRVAATCVFLGLVGVAFCANEVWSTFEVNHFRVVGVARDAELGDIKRAYKARALVMHPDKNPGDPTADDKFAKLHDAYNTSVLAHPARWARPAAERVGLDSVVAERLFIRPPASCRADSVLRLVMPLCADCSTRSAASRTTAGAPRAWRRWTRATTRRRR